MIRVDPEFQALIPPLTADEYAQLEKNILKDGIRDPLVVWKTQDGKEILIDGHNRWKISAEHGGLPFNIQYMQFDARSDVMVWIIDKQLGQRNLSLMDKVTLQDKRKDVLAEEAKRKAIEGNSKGGSKSEKNSCPSSAQTNQEKRKNSTDYKIAKAAGTSEDTVRKVRLINEKADERTKQLIRDGEKSINQAVNEIKAKEIKRMPTAQEYQDAAQKRHDAVKDAKTVSIADLQRDKEDRKILEDAAIAKVRRARDAVSKLYVETSNGELNIDVLSQSVKERLSGDVESMINTLKAIQTAIERE